MNLSIFDDVAQADLGSLVIDEASLYRAFEQVKDGRKKKGKRYPLALILTLLLLGKLAGEQSINGIVDWIKERQPWIRQVLAWPRPFPVNATYSFALANCDGHEVAQAIAHVLLKARAVAACENESSRLVASSHEPEHLIHTAWMVKCFVAR